MAVNNGINQPLATWTGTTTLTTLGTIATGTWNGSVVGLTYGGSNAALTASNGGVVYTTASAMAVLSGTATASQVLMSGASTTPAWSTTTYPSTSATGNIPYASGTNVYANLAPNSSASITQLLSMINSTPSWFTLNSINAQTGTTYTVVLSDYGKLITLNNASAVTVTLPQQSTTTTAAGFFCWFLNIGTGQVTIVKQGAETLTGNVILNQYAECKVERPTTTSWATFGGTATVQDCFTLSVGGALLNQSYDIVSYAPTTGTVLGVTTKSTSLGTAGTYTVAINGSTVTGLSAIANSTARTYTSASAANTYNRGDYITITLSGTITAVDLFATLDVTRSF